MVSESDAAPNEQPEPQMDAKVQRRLPQEAQDNVDLAVRASSRCLPLLAENKCIQFRTAYGVPVWHCHHFALILHGMCRCVRLFCAGLRVMNVNLTSISSLPPPHHHQLHLGHCGHRRDDWRVDTAVRKDCGDVAVADRVGVGILVGVCLGWLSDR